MMTGTRSAGTGGDGPPIVVENAWTPGAHSWSSTRHPDLREQSMFRKKSGISTRESCSPIAIADTTSTESMNPAN